METTKITLPCSNGFTLHIRGSNLVVETARSEKLFPIQKIQSFTLKEPHGLSFGKIIFRTAEAASAGLNLGFGFSAALGAEQTFFFTKANLEMALRLRDYISDYEKASASAEKEKDSGSLIEELRGLKVLVDEGVLTQEEFEAKKRQLLGI